MSYCASFFLMIWLHILVRGGHSLHYGDVEALGVSCPDQHKCERHLSMYTYDCRCDSACDTYGDCCIDAGKKTSGQARNTSFECYVYNKIDGIYAVTECSKQWNGPLQVKQKCVGPADFSDPFSAAPVTSTSQQITYKNLYCAECNNADLESLKPFDYRLFCRNVDLPQKQIMDNLSYNQELNVWGVYRWGPEGKLYFSVCTMLFRLPNDLHESVRPCRANIISKCAPDWNQPEVAKLCSEYNAVVLYFGVGYRNPHCAICNNIDSLQRLNCKESYRLKFGVVALAFPDLINLYVKDERSNRCIAGQSYDPFARKCKQLRCAFPGYVLENDKCVPGS